MFLDVYETILDFTLYAKLIVKKYILYKHFVQVVVHG